MVYLVTYDMHKSYNYDGVADAIDKISTDSCRIQDSVWFINSSRRAKDIYLNIQSCISNKDELLVIEVTSNWSTNSWTKSVGDKIRSWF